MKKNNHRKKSHGVCVYIMTILFIDFEFVTLNIQLLLFYQTEWKKINKSGLIQTTKMGNLPIIHSEICNTGKHQNSLTILLNKLLLIAH